MKTKSSKTTKQPKSKRIIKDIPPKGNPQGGMAYYGAGGTSPTPNRLADP
jgi:hypothetical protein